jgi:F-type H+-transporting ATPase subunit delta
LKTDTRVTAYTQALLEIALVENQLDQVEEDLLGVSSALKSNLELKDALFRDKVPAAKKKEIMMAIFGKKLAPMVMNFICLIIDEGREELLSSLGQEFSKKAYGARNMAQAEIITAVPIDEELKMDIGKRLAQVFKKEIEIKSRVDESIIGGLVIKVEGKVIDGSVRHQLEDLRETLTSGK